VVLKQDLYLLQILQKGMNIFLFINHLNIFLFNSFRQSTILNVTLACDHRVIDGAVGAQWLQEFKQFLENPASMIL
jgi:pyruvate/2-oxoglutarate dehydrogenase complex dihydrolipoamide acyltransferase (E2) component